MSITVGSTIQISLLVAPVLVAIAAVVCAVNAIVHDGETTWFERVLLLAINCYSR